ncbi:carbohydrate ABC transporter permease [Lactobacillus gigeriorum]|uniref:ABC superfamily ATP binding cassette transporter, permease protein n=1 Tax=Lactobacillus gigeriorum DSM 23908 = CRBIP 24.85 TaxID=1423751 RepID=I7LFQ6_9LACO|nr:carbohydrate ABC transporter permease [Lactobacillus gigeriorum]KRN12276.1 abc superfamily atp binding cassette transporter, permease protein [Lactobacillus gigeriorum DSM 23908 = CRBIP 24.85]CCI86878.1 ABC superfamily ATP binding cassette transporter, permease protein [Lactobacillus gigeriorum DSM 23908 = CRBIP 24.85]
MKKFRIGVIVAYLILAIFAIITVYPFIYMILGGLMSFQETTKIPPTLWPSKPQWSNYARVFAQAPFARYFFNTLLTASVTTIVSLFNSLLGAFAMVNLRFKGKGIVQVVLLSLLMVPGEAIIFTNYNTIAQLGLLNTYIGLVLPFLTSIFYMYYLQSYFGSISPTIYKASMIDGASDWEYIWKILVPMSRGGLFTVGLLSFISGWNSFLWPLLVTNEDSMRLLNNGLTAFASDAGSETQLQLAAATLTVLPILILYFIFRKQIIRGVVRNDLKG